MEITFGQLKRINNDFEKIAEHTGCTEIVCGCLYHYTAEIGTLRLLKKYRMNEKADCGYSENLKSYYFRLETNLTGDMTTPDAR